MYLGRSAGGRAVAIKMVHPELAEGEEFRRRFRREAAVARTVGGAYAVPVFDADPAAGVPWLASEFLPSMSLDEAVRDAGPLPPVRSGRWRPGWPRHCGRSTAPGSCTGT